MSHHPDTRALQYLRGYHTSLVIHRFRRDYSISRDLLHSQVLLIHKKIHTLVRRVVAYLFLCPHKTQEMLYASWIGI